MKQVQPRDQEGTRGGGRANQSVATLERDAPEEPQAELPILAALHRTNAKVLTTLEKLAIKHTPDQCVELLRYVERQLAIKREIEARLIPLLHDRDLADDIEELRHLDATTERDLALLHETEPSGTEFVVAVEMFRSTVELQVEFVRDVFEPAWISELDPVRATDLARDIHP